jgi:hypothetical protein
LLQVELARVAQPGQGVLKIYGNWDDGRPAATSAKPERGPKENMNVCVPSASVMKPSPPEICWHLMAPFTVPGFGVTKSPEVPDGTPAAGVLNCVGPVYAGSVLLHPVPMGLVVQLLPVIGCVMVPCGHCTRND